MPLLYVKLEPKTECFLTEYKDYYFIYDSNNAIVYNKIVINNVGSGIVNIINTCLPYHRGRINDLAVDKGASWSIKDNYGGTSIVDITLEPLQINPQDHFSITIIFHINAVCNANNDGTVYLPVSFYNMHPFKGEWGSMSFDPHKDCPLLKVNGLDITVVLPKMYVFCNEVNLETDPHKVNEDNLGEALSRIKAYVQEKNIYNASKTTWNNGSFAKYTAAQLSQLKDEISPDLRGRRKTVGYRKKQGINIKGYEVTYVNILVAMLAIISIVLSLLGFYLFNQREGEKMMENTHVSVSETELHEKEVEILKAWRTCGNKDVCRICSSCGKDAIRSLKMSVNEKQDIGYKG